MMIKTITKPGSRPVNWQLYLLSKRVMDLFFSVLLTGLVLVWLLPLLALLIKLDSRGPVFFLQKRVGMGGRLFICYKLRTMRVNSEADERPAAEGDERITRIGVFLRRSHLDELPQLWNVLMGSMSLVGPRPYMPADNRRFSDQVPDHRIREQVRPGITGLAQVRGFHGPVGDVKTIVHRWEWDVFYVSNAGMSLDLQILQETIRLFFTQKDLSC